MGYNTLPYNPFPPSTEQKGNSGSSYVLPISSSETLGGVKVGSGLSIDAETGVLSVLSGSGKNVIGIDNDTYSALTTEEKNSGDLYIVNTNREIPTNPIDMSNIIKFEEGSTTITATSASVTTIATNGASIGATYYYTNKIDVTDLDIIRCTVKAIAHYTPFADRLSLTVGLCENAPASFVSDYSSLNYTTYKKVTDNGDFTLDIDTSVLTGEFYIVVNCAGWTATIENLLDDTTSTTEVSNYDVYFKSTKLLTKEV